MSVYIQIVWLLFAYATFWFVISLIKKRNDVADIAWGMGYVLVCVFIIFTQSTSNLFMLISVLVAIWGVRLSTHIYIRNRNKAEDFRYNQWRKEWGKTFLWRSYLQVYLLQAFLLFIIALPIMLAANFPHVQLTIWSLLGVLLWLIGFVFQAVGDYQLSKFVKSRTNKEAIMNTGLWRFSRHPNYFGEVVMWWGIFVCILPLPNSAFFIISPITITLLIRYVSGVPMLEKRYENNQQYQAYKKEVPALFPKLW